ncbi:hypothetical protein H7J86_32795 [Mycobacterium hackensackense]|uniref:hypothetical protein n=1 Tax=Mycobacterium hackensackense TaxID=228909 RepID=UPI002265E830|nr:hypothetical protein [Mycobacterium hackensackense]MCV7256964.1 hypothetical protein [Mycobacterium hackensackense]
MSGSQHKDPAMTVRVPPGLKGDARHTLAGRGLELQAFVVACLTALRAEPEQVLAVVEPYWPDPKPRGRPRRDEPPVPPH